MSKLDFPKNLCLSPDEKQLYVSDFEKKCIHVIHTKDGSHAQTIGPLQGPSGIDGRELFIISNGNDVYGIASPATVNYMPLIQ